MSIKLHPTQQEAVDKAIANNFFIINGGAGRGKTFIIKMIALAIKELGEKVELCAFAGKAAARLRESTEMSAGTIHRMLCYNGTTFSRGKMEETTVIIDEASMVSTDLMVEIVHRKPKRLILIGDQAQLPPVGKGQPFHDIIELRPDKVCTLTKCFRNSAAVFDASMLIRDGILPSLSDQSGNESWEVARAGSAEIAHDMIVKNVKAGNMDFEQDIILCPRNGDSEESPCTVKGLNKSIVDIVNPREDDETKFMVGDRVINTKNFSDSDVWNGTTGTIHSIDSDKEMWIRLDSPTEEGESIIQFNKEMIKELQLAYALSVHKSQGSQYRTVVFCALDRDSHTLMSRSLIYTAVTRAKNNCVVVGQLGALKRGIDKINKKTTALQEIAKKGMI